MDQHTIKTLLSDESFTRNERNFLKVLVTAIEHTKFGGDKLEARQWITLHEQLVAFVQSKQVLEPSNKETLA